MMNIRKASELSLLWNTQATKAGQYIQGRAPLDVHILYLLFGTNIFFSNLQCYCRKTNRK